MSGKTRVGVLFGGRSAEHEVSIISARGVIGAIDRERFEPVPFGVTLGGALLTPAQSQRALDASASGALRALREPAGEGILSRPRAFTALQGVDVVFPLIHGKNGEDGTVQGFLELARLPYVGADVAGSALGLNKGLMKEAFRNAGLPIVDYIVLDWAQMRDDVSGAAATGAIVASTGFPCFVKPGNGGSSLGISRVRSGEDLPQSLRTAARYDRTLIVERALAGAREIECSVLGNDAPEASPPGELVPDREFYDYEAKYSPTSRTELRIPAPLDAATTDRVRDLAVRAFRAVGCSGMGRVDFLLTPDGALYVSEINTIPGFTPISMYPKLWEAAGLNYPALISRLIDLALERHEERERYAEAYTVHA